MDTTNKRSLIALPIILIIASLIALAGSQTSVEILGIPLYVVCVVLAFLIQWISFIPAFIYKTERFYDLTGSITYILITSIAVVLSPAPDGRTFLLLGIIIIWALRLGLFLFTRIRAVGEDRRFRDIKSSFFRFLLAWTLQGLWITFSLAAALAAIASSDKEELGVYAIVGFLVWLIGFSIEVISDYQKSQFKSNPNNNGIFIKSGLWSWSRHPNYFGEIILWIGVAIISFPMLQGWSYLTLISPIFIIILLTRISGVPLLEKRADGKWGGQDDYEEYKARTSVLILLPPSNKLRSEK